MLKLRSFKTQHKSISSELLKNLKEELKLSTFVETGTYLGETTQEASKMYDKVHSIELSEVLFNRALEKFETIDNIQLYLGDSGEILADIAKFHNQNVCFWLDGHYSEGETAKGDESTPIIKELHALSNANLENYVILIDDIRIFQQSIENNPESLKGYPTFMELKKLQEDLFPNSDLKLLGDFAIIYEKDKLNFSKLIEAITESRLYPFDKEPDKNLFKFEKIIANAKSEEKETLLNLCYDYDTTEKYGIGCHYRLWRGLILLKEGKFDESQIEFKKAVKLGIGIQRVKKYQEMAEKNDNSLFNIEMLSLDEKDLFFDENNDVKSPDDLLENMVGKNIFYEAENVVFAGVHKFQEKELIESIFPNLMNALLLEPVPEIADQLSSNLESDDRYKVINAALSDKTGTAEFHITDNEAMSSSLLELGRHNELFPYVKETGKITVNTVTFADLLINNDYKCDTLILDVQGAEYLILSSIPSNLLSNIKFIYTEVSKTEIYKNANTLDDIKDILADNFIFAGYAPNTNDVKEHGNALFINKDIAKEYYHYLNNNHITDRILIATTIAPKNIEVQKKAINSWQKLGFEVVSINSKEEINILKTDFSSENFIETEKTAKEAFGKPLIYFDAFREYLSEQSYKYVGIINSDIELITELDLQKALIENLDKSMIFGSRNDFEKSEPQTNDKYKWGFDYFFFDKELLSLYPESDFCIGMPWWDYWVPAFLLKSRKKVKYLENKIAFHELHELNYKQENWIDFAKQFAEKLYPNYYKMLQNDDQMDVFSNIDSNYNRTYEIAQSLSNTALEYIKNKAQNIMIENQNTTPKISVITPSYNSSKYIQETIDSVKMQNLKDYEHIITDGNSTDGTVDILKKENHLKWVSEPDNGQSDAVNKGFKMAKGEIIAWINSDDKYYDETVFEKVVEAFDKNPDVKIIIGDCIFDYEGKKPQLHVKNKAFNFDRTIRYWQDFVPPTQPSIFFKRDLLDEFGYLDEDLNYAMDYDLWLRFTQKHPIYHISHKLSVYRFIPESKSGTGEDWSHFYPEWHKVYSRYKHKSIKMPLQPFVSVVFPVIDDDEYIKKLNSQLRDIQSQIMKDMEIVLIADHDCESKIEESDDDIIPIHLVKINEINKNSFKNAALLHSNGVGIHCPVVDIKMHPKLYSMVADFIIDNNSWDNIADKKQKPVKHPKLEFDAELGQNIIKNREAILLNEDIEASGDLYFSVIIPTYNRSEVLRKCLLALDNQDFDKNDFEVIVIDDGSNDDTQDVVENFDSSYKLHYIKQENSGPAEARNKGIKKAIGKYLLILNDDTIADKNLIAKHKEYRNKYADKKIALLGSFDYVKEARIKPFTHFLSKTPLVFAYPIMKDQNVYNYRYFWTCNISILRESVIKAGLFDNDFREPMTEDTELGYRLEKIGYKVIYIPDAKSEHDHSMDIHGFAKRQEMSGRNVVKLFNKHPEILKKERKLFGFEDLDKKTLDYFRDYIAKNEEQANQNIKFFEDIEKLNIYNPKFITVDKDNTIEVDQLMKAMQKNIWVVHFVNFYKGILEAIDSKDDVIENVDDKTEEPQIEDNNYDSIRNKIFEITSKIRSKPKEEIIEDEPEIITEEINTEPKKRILFTMYGWNHSGGGTMFPRSVANELTKRGYEVAVFYTALAHPENKAPYYLEKKKEAGIILYGVYNRMRDFKMPDLPEYEIRDEKVLEHWKSILDEFNPDIIHYHNFLGLSFAIAEEAKNRNIKTFYTPHNYHLIDPELYMINDNLNKWQNVDFFSQSKLYAKYKNKAALYDKRFMIAKDMLNFKIDKTFAISRRVKELFIDFGADHRKIDVLYQAPKHLEEIKRIGLNLDKKLRIGYIGSVLYHKGVHNLAIAANLSKPNVEFKVYGDGHSRFINELIKISNKRLFFKGRYKLSDLNKIAEEIDIFVVPSVWEEGAGLIIQEAYAMGKPVIGANIGGIPEFIDYGKNGFTYPYNSPRNMASIINYLSDNPNKLREMDANIHPTTSFDEYIEKLLDYYES